MMSVKSPDAFRTTDFSERILLFNMNCRSGVRRHDSPNNTNSRMEEQWHLSKPS